MKSMQMEGGSSAYLQQELRSLKKTSDRTQYMLIALLVLVAALVIALIAVGASQGRTIRHLQAREGLLPNPNVSFATQSGDRNVQGLSYGGSLFRGSGFWANKNPLAESLTDHAAIGYNEVVYILGGSKDDGNATDEVWKYDSVFHNYTKMAPMPQPRYRFGAAIIDSTIYVVGGRNVSDDRSPQPNDGLVKSAFIYDINSNAWTVGAEALDYQGDSCAAALDGKVYLIGGYGAGYSYLNTSEAYDPATNTWTRLPDMPTPRGDLMCVALDEEIYALGGYYDPSNVHANSFSSKMESFNPSTNAWSSRPDLLTARGDAGAVALEGNRIMVVGGEGHYRQDDNYKYPKHVNEVYYASEETWVQKAMIPTARFRTAAATAGGLAFVFGGADVCIDQPVCPGLSSNEVFLDLDHPHVYVYLKNEAYNDNAALTTYPL